MDDNDGALLLMDRTKTAPLAHNDFVATTSLASGDGEEGSTTIGEEDDEDNEQGNEGQNHARAPFFKYRLSAVQHRTAPTLPEAYHEEYQELWNTFWNEALLCVEAYENKTTKGGCWRLFWYPRLPMFLIFIGLIIGVVFVFKQFENDDNDDKEDENDDRIDVLKAIVTVLLSFGVVGSLNVLESRLRNQHRSECLQEMRRVAETTFMARLAAQQRNNNNNRHHAIILCDDHTSNLEKIRNISTGFHVTLWLPLNDNSNNGYTSTTPLQSLREVPGLSICRPHSDYCPSNANPYYRVLLHKGNWYRKLFCLYKDVPSVRSSILSQLSPRATATAPGQSMLDDDWYAFWERMQTIQNTMQKFHLLTDGLPLLMYPVCMTMLVAQQLYKWVILAGCAGFLVLIFCLVAAISRRRVKFIKETLPDDIRQVQALERRIYDAAGLYMDYRVIMDYENDKGTEECHYIYIFTTTPLSPLAEEDPPV